MNQDAAQRVADRLAAMYQRADEAAEAKFGTRPNGTAWRPCDNTFDCKGSKHITTCPVGNGFGSTVPVGGSE